MSRQTIEEEFKRPPMNGKSNKRLNSNQSVNSHVTSSFVGASYFGNGKKDSNKSIANILKLDNDKIPVDISLAQHLLVAPQKRRRSKRNSIHVINNNITSSILGVDTLSIGAQRMDSTPGGNVNDLRLMAPQIKVQKPSQFRRNSARHSPDAKLEKAGTNFFNIVAQTANANRVAMQMVKNTRRKMKAQDRGDKENDNSSSSNDEIMIIHQMTQPIDLKAINDENNQHLELSHNNSNFNFDQELLSNQAVIPSIQTPFTQKGPPIKKDSSEQFVDRFIQQFQPLNRDQEQQMRDDRQYRQNMRNLESQIMVNYKINKKIASMDIEDVNRNTRFFRDYIKDQLKTTKKAKKHIFDSGNDPKLDRQDSLTEKIQQESNAFLRRMSYKGKNNRNDIIKKERMLKLGKNKSQKQVVPQTIVRNTLNTTNNPNQEGPSQNLMDDDQSYKYTTQEDSYGQRANIQRKDQRRINATLPEGQTEEDDGLEEINEEQIRKIDNIRLYRYLIYPDSQIRSIVDGASFIFLLMISLYVPFIISFNITSSMSFTYFEMMIDLWFIMEIFMNFFTGYYERGALIMNRKKIIKNYLQGWFLIDLFSSMPISFLDIALYEEESTGGSFSVYQSAKLIRILRMARYARLLRLLRFIKANKLLLTMEVVIVSEHANLLIRFLKISIILTFITHWISCILYLIGSSQLEETGRSWLLIYKLQDSSVAEIYVNCLYWAFTTMCTVGYGDFHPVTTYERLISIFCMLLSSGMFAYVIGDIGRMVSNHNLLAAQFREKMIYVDKFLRLKQIPINLRQQVKRYLEYNWALKKIYKIEEQEVLGLMNDNLRGKITVYFNGKILQNIEVLCKFPIEFLSNLSFILQKQTYAIDDNLIVEKESGNEIFFMVSGKVSVIHRHTKTHITDLFMDSYFGEISFFSELQRSATVTARDFTEVLILKREDFLLMAVKISQGALEQYHKIRESLNYGKRDYRQLCIKCYICYAYGHIALDCKQFNRLKGNLKRYYKKLYKRSIEDSISDSEDYRRQNPLVVSLESNQENNVELQKQLRKTRQKAKREERRRKSIAKRQSISSAAGQTPIRFESQLQENSIKNIVLYPIEMQDQINKSDEDPIQANSSFKQQSTKRKTFASFFHKNTKNSSLLNTSEHSLHHQASKGPRNFDNSFEVADNENVFQFDNENRGNTLRNKKDRMNFDKEIMEIQEEDDEDDFEEEKQKPSEEIESYSPSTPRSSSHNSGNDTDQEQPLLTQRKRMVDPKKPPKSQNQLTKIMGKKKRFGSKQKRMSDADINSLKPSMSKRQITIMPVNDFKKKEVQTVVKKTFTTRVETYIKKEVEYGKGGKPMKNAKKSNNNSSNSGTSGGQSHEKYQEDHISPFKQFERSKEPQILNIKKISTKLAVGSSGRNKPNDEVVTKDESFQSGLKHLQSKSITESFGEIATHRPTAMDQKKVKRKLSKGTNLKVSEDDYDFKSSESKRQKHGFNQNSKQNSKNSKFKNLNIQRDSLMVDTDSNEEWKDDHQYLQKSSRLRTHSIYEQQAEHSNTLLVQDQNQFKFYENQSKNKERRESSLEEQFNEILNNKSTSRKYTKQFTPSKNNP